MALLPGPVFAFAQVVSPPSEKAYIRDCPDGLAEASVK